MSIVFETRHHGQARHLFVLTAYMDESGHESDRVVIAGFMGNKEQWERFEQEWRRALGRRRQLHLADLRWRKQKTKILLTRLGPIPYRCGLTRLRSEVVVSHYADLIPDDVVSKKLHKGYFVALMPLLLRVLDELPKTERIEFVFEEQKEFELLATAMFRVLSKHKTRDGKRRLSGVRFVPKDSTVLLQPADYLAYALTQIRRDPHTVKSHWVAPIILGGTAEIAAVISREDVRHVIAKCI